MRNLLITIGLCALLAAKALAAETQTAWEVRSCKQENGRFTYDHPSMGKLVDLTQSGFDSMITEAGGSTTTEVVLRDCPKARVSVVSALKSWFRTFTEREPELSTEDTQKSNTSKNGDFEAVLMMTQDAESVLANTGEFTMFDEWVSINREEGIEALLLVRGCTANSNGDCLVTADYVIKSPDGSTYLKTLNTDVWKENTSPFLRYKLTNTRIGFVLPSDAGAGLYEVDVTVSDKISDTKLSLHAKVLLLEENEKV